MCSSQMNFISAEQRELWSPGTCGRGVVLYRLFLFNYRLHTRHVYSINAKEMVLLP